MQHKIQGWWWFFNFVAQVYILRKNLHCDLKSATKNVLQLTVLRSKIRVEITTTQCGCAFILAIQYMVTFYYLYNIQTKESIFFYSLFKERCVKNISWYLTINHEVYYVSKTDIDLCMIYFTFSKKQISTPTRHKSLNIYVSKLVTYSNMNGTQTLGIWRDTCHCVSEQAVLWRVDERTDNVRCRYRIGLMPHDKYAEKVNFESELILV